MRLLQKQHCTAMVVFDKTLFLQGEIAEKKIDILVKTISKGRWSLAMGNITTAMTQAGLGLDNTLHWHGWDGPEALLQVDCSLFWTSLA